MIKDMCCVIDKDNNQEACNARHLIFSGFKQFELRKLYSDNDVQEERAELWWWCGGCNGSLSSIQSGQTIKQ